MRGLGGVAKKFVLNVWLVFVSQILEIRHRWVWSVVMVSLFPLSIMGFLLLFGGATPERVLYIVTGAITNAVSIQAGLSLGQHIGGMKAYRVFDYYASLPISKLSFILGLNLNALVLCIPSTLILMTVSWLAFRLRVVDLALFVAAFVLGGFSLAGVGAMIGFYSRSSYIASILTQIVEPILAFFAPVYIPESVLPTFLRLTAPFFPTTHVAWLLRAAFGNPAEQIWQPIVILGGFIFVTVLLVQHGLDWRGDRPLA